MRYSIFCAAALLAAGLAPASEAGPFVSDKVTVETYLIDGESLPQLKNQLRLKGPKGFWGLTKTNWRWDGSCNIRFSATITMPKLKDRSKLDADELAEWDRMIEALRAHEDGHVEIGRKWAGEIKAAKCRSNKVEAINKKWRAKEIAFDRDTDHGRTEGVHLNQ